MSKRFRIVKISKITTSYEMITSSPKSFYSKTPKLDSTGKRKIYMSMYLSENEKNKEIVNKIFNPRSFALFKSLDLSTLNEHNGVFSAEKNSEGKRSFFINTFSEVFDLYKALKEPHVYEVIVENRPCHLYFDVEYKFEEHPEYKGDEMVNRLISLVDEKLFEIFGQDDYEVIHLDATSEVKFSRHLIFRSDYFCFSNNRQVATFVQKEILSDPEMALIVDPAVYSKNRNFRCIWSTKQANGAKYPLVPIDGKNTNPHDSNLDFFKKTLITFVGANPHCIGYPEKESVQWSSTKYTTSNGMITVPYLNDSALKCTGIQDFALSVFAPSGMIRSAQYSPEFRSLTFIIKGCRYCHRIGREHKSNSIYLVVRLSDATIVQKCFDPDCRGFESDPIQIPEPIYNQLRDQYLNVPQELDILPKKVNPQKLNIAEEDGTRINSTKD
ncbi:hypothetical protein TRFO_23091 [Tritrichomonas foetus]|uniref:DNA-directed primase/polymerase protein n=1 Tax=Tritrichomonas foetus TaxID=1144522 RepID=A0A1J4KBR5_9EUKA|nr:hypothetical protein TRFO_23091 [Tritrichomonas foetus]|eukprot:OHT08410.1 hypothetical protein TRFO_23091 [Tritrichomonas foetus]